MKEGSGKARPSVLIVDDQFRTLNSLTRFIPTDGFETLWVPDDQHALEILRKEAGRDWIVIVDLKSSGMGGGGFLHSARKIVPRAAFLVTGPLGPFLYKDGEFYEFCWPTLKQQIGSILNGIAKGLGDREPTVKSGRAKALDTRRRQRMGAIIGRSRSINAIYDTIRNVSGSDATILIQGESGTGKELVARGIHETSRRKSGPFVAINCGAIPVSLIESELFGHERGAFTGALYQKKGKFEMACGGTLFLDEIGELDRDLQVKLLRVLQEREFQRVGGNVTIKADARIIAATARDLKGSVQTGEFREDLFYRLNVVPVHLPPLRERPEDIPLLLDHLLYKTVEKLECPLPDLTEEAREALQHYTYPGNVRELANIVERLLVTCREGQIGIENMPQEVLDEVRPGSGTAEMLKVLPDEGVQLRDVERELIVKTLEKVSGNKVAAARMLGITRRLLYLRLAEYGLEEGEPCHLALHHS